MTGPRSEAGAASQLAAAAAAVRAGEVIGLPTDTVYGIGADPYRPAAARRIFHVKGRPSSVALPVLIAEPDVAFELARVEELASELIGRHWPGPLTLVMWRADGLELHLGGDERTVGVRCPGHRLARALLAETGPLAVTSANRHGEAPATTPDMVREQLGDGLAVVVDGGVCDGAPSTVVSLLGDEPAVLRLGALSASALGIAPREGEGGQ